jgi:hypothetical protein
MIANVTELNVALHQLSSFADMLEALRLDAESTNDWTMFSHLSKGYFIRIHQINTEIREYLKDLDDTRHVETAAEDAVVTA